MGPLAGRYGADTRFDPQDLRAHGIDWMAYFQDGRPDPAWLRRVAAVRQVLTAGGRTPAQGAVGWIWARSAATIPVRGVRTVAQATANAAAMTYGRCGRSSWRRSSSSSRPTPLARRRQTRTVVTMTIRVHGNAPGAVVADGLMTGWRRAPSLDVEASWGSAVDIAAGTSPSIGGTVACRDEDLVRPGAVRA